MASIRDVEIARRERETKFELNHNVTWGVIAAVNGTTSPPNEPNLTWVDEFNKSSNRKKYLNPTTLKTAGTVVRLGPDESPPYRKIIGLRTEGLTQGSIVPLDQFNTPNHAPNHQWPTEATKGEDVVKIYQPAWQPLKTTGNGTNLTVETQPLNYTVEGARKVFPGASTSLTSYVPGSGLVRRVLLYLDANTNTIETIQGTAVTNNGAIPIPYPVVPSGMRGSAWVKLANGQTAVTTATHIDDARDTADSANSGRFVRKTGDTMTGALIIDGSEDTPQLTIQGNATQTANILLIETSAGTDLLTLNNAGQLALPIQGVNGGVSLANELLLYQFGTGALALRGTTGNASLYISPQNANTTSEIRIYDGDFATLKGRLIFAGLNPASSRYIGLLNDAADYLLLGTISATDVVFATNGLNRGRFTSAGMFEVTGGPIRAQGTISETAISADRIDIGVLGGTPRILFEDGGSSTIYEIDNASGVFRIFKPGTELFRLDTNGQLALVTSGSTGGLLIGSDVQLYRESADILRLADGDDFIIGDLAVDNAGLNLQVSGRVLFKRTNAGVVGSVVMYNANTTNGNGLALGYNTNTTGTGATVNLDMAQIVGVFDTHDHPTRAAHLSFRTSQGAGVTERMRIDAGVQVGAPTGGDKGAGTGNFAGDIYKNNSAFLNPDYVLEHWRDGYLSQFKNSPGADSYQGLLPLEQLEYYLRQHLHLPGRPDTAMGIFDRSDIVQGWLEELAIYITQLHKRVKELEYGNT